MMSPKSPEPPSPAWALTQLSPTCSLRRVPPVSPPVSPPSPPSPGAAANIFQLPPTSSIRRHKSRSSRGPRSRRPCPLQRHAGDVVAGAGGPAGPRRGGPTAARAGRPVAPVEENVRQAVQRGGGRGGAEADLGEKPQIHQPAQPGARAGRPHLPAGHEPPGGHDQRGGGEDHDGLEGPSWPPTSQRDPLRPRLDPASPGGRGLEEERLRDARQEPGPVRLVLGVQLGGRAGGAAEAQDGEAAPTQPPEPGGLRGQQRRLRRRLHDQRLRVRAAEPRHRLRGRLPLHRPGRELHVQPQREGGQVPRLPGDPPGQREGSEKGRGQDRPRLRRHRRQPALLPVLQPRRLLRRELQRREHQPRGAGGGLRRAERHQALDHQEQLGRGVGQQGLRPAGPEHEQRLRHRQPRQLPQDVSAPGSPASKFCLFPPNLQSRRCPGPGGAEILLLRGEKPPILIFSEAPLPRRVVPRMLHPSGDARANRSRVPGSSAGGKSPRGEHGSTVPGAAENDTTFLFKIKTLLGTNTGVGLLCAAPGPRWDEAQVVEQSEREGFLHHFPFLG